MEPRISREGGGGRPVLPLAADFDSAERLYGREPADTLTPERLYDRRWALTLLDAVLLDLQNQYTAGGKAKLFDSLKPYLTGDVHAPPQAQIAAAALGLSEGAVQVAVHRLRKRYRELLRSHISQTGIARTGRGRNPRSVPGGARLYFESAVVTIGVASLFVREAASGGPVEQHDSGQPAAPERRSRRRSLAPQGPHYKLTHRETILEGGQRCLGSLLSAAQAGHPLSMGDPRLVHVVREAFASKASRADLVSGRN